MTHRPQSAVMAFSFEKLLDYQKSVAFADAVCAATRGFPRGYFFLRDQLNRAALSIATQYTQPVCLYASPISLRRFTLLLRRTPSEPAMLHPVTSECTQFPSLLQAQPLYV
jgi:hypothetical protein